MVPGGRPIRIARVRLIRKSGKLPTDGIKWRVVSRESPFDVDEPNFRVVDPVFAHPVSGAGDVVQRPDIIVDAERETRQRRFTALQFCCSLTNRSRYLSSK